VRARRPDSARPLSAGFGALLSARRHRLAVLGSPFAMAILSVLTVLWPRSLYYPVPGTHLSSSYLHGPSRWHGRVL